MPTLEERIAVIEVRNRRVEEDKAWETSWFRKGVIAGMTYIVIVVFFLVADVGRPLLNAIVPTLGFVLSTLSLPLFRALWARRHHRSRAS